MNPVRGRAVPDVLTALLDLALWDEELSDRAVADRLGVTTAAAADGVDVLVEQGLLSRRDDGVVSLTPEGRATVVDLVRRQRLVETYLVEVLGYGWDEVRDEAEALEQVGSTVLVERMAEGLGHPVRDPHGCPVPTPEGVVHRPALHPVADLEPGRSAHVARVADDDPALLRWFAAGGVRLDVELRRAAAPGSDDGLVVEVGAERRRLTLHPRARAALWFAEHPPSSETPDCPFPGCRHDQLGTRRS